MSVSRFRATVSLGVLVAIVLPSCSHSDGEDAQAPLPSDSAVDLTGTLRVMGGPAPGIDKPLGGTVTFTGPVTEQVTAQQGRFTVNLPPGEYEVKGHPKGYFAAATCPPATMTVTAQQGLPVEVTCLVE